MKKNRGDFFRALVGFLAGGRVQKFNYSGKAPHQTVARSTGYTQQSKRKQA